MVIILINSWNSISDMDIGHPIIICLLSRFVYLIASRHCLNFEKYGVKGELTEKWTNLINLGHNYIDFNFRT